MNDVTQFTLVEIEDGANFNQVLARRVFRYDSDAWTWGTARRDEFRAKRRAEGEKDEVFIEAIEYRSFHIDCED